MQHDHFRYHFVKTVHSIMRARGVSQTYLARQSGLTPPAVCKMLRNGTLPRSDILFRFAHVLDVSVDNFAPPEWRSVENLHPVTQHLDRIVGELSEEEQWMAVAALEMWCVVRRSGRHHKTSSD